MNRNNRNKERTGLSFFALLQLAFIILKVSKVIEWSWWLVFIPTYIDLGVAILIEIIIAAITNTIKKGGKRGGVRRTKKNN